MNWQKITPETDIDRLMSHPDVLLWNGRPARLDDTMISDRGIKLVAVDDGGFVRLSIFTHYCIITPPKD